ncbi:MAG: DUF2878 domain-containing protein [Bryobacteraceae bacterium]
MPLWLNIALFQAGWWACVLSAAAGFPSAGVAVSAVAIAANIYFLGYRVVMLVAAAIGIGFASDTALIRAAAIGFPGHPALAPMWMLALWGNFAAALPVSMAWLTGRYVLAAALGGLAGPASYLAGQSFGAIHVGNPWMVALEWLVALPLLVRISERLP